MSSAIVTYAPAPAELPRRSRRGATSVVQFASGGVVADVRVERVDKRNRCSWYAVKLAANTSEVNGRLVGVTRRGDLEQLGSVDVAPGSIGSARFAVTTPRTGAYRSMYLEIRSDDMLMRVDAPRPPAAKRFGGWKAAAMIFTAGAGASVAGAVAWGFAHDAKPVAPAHAAASAVPHIVVAAPVVPARVLSFSARRDSTPGGGESVLASYLAVGDRGTIALLDSAGTIVSTGPFTRVGTLRLNVPKQYRLLPMIAQITVHRGATKAVSTVTVPPLNLATPAPSPSPSASPSSSDIASADAPEGITPIASASSGTSAGIVAIEGRAVAGKPLHLRVTPQQNAMHMELEDESGATLTEGDIPAHATHAVIALPPSDTRATYLLALHYTDNGGEETVIRTVVATPH
ncbi:MAG TPA: hypothetical protein VHS78_14345 [Candidatus Elarobacter sp.]|jgi:hypothetical protein|nr:hypothetical protein [Candidatus Elarobacter sp.]